MLQRMLAIYFTRYLLCLVKVHMILKFVCVCIVNFTMIVTWRRSKVCRKENYIETGAFHWCGCGVCVFFFPFGTKKRTKAKLWVFVFFSSFLVIAIRIIPFRNERRSGNALGTRTTKKQIKGSYKIRQETGEGNLEIAIILAEIKRKYSFWPFSFIGIAFGIVFSE